MISSDKYYLMYLTCPALWNDLILKKKKMIFIYSVFCACASVCMYESSPYLDCLLLLSVLLYHLSVSRIYFVLICLDWLVLCHIQRTFGVSSLQEKDRDGFRRLASAVYLQVSTISQALIFVTRSRNWSFVERPGFLLVAAFVVAQLVGELLIFPFAFCDFIYWYIAISMTYLSILWHLQVATLIAVYANWGFAAVEGIGWGWAGVIWLYNLIFYFPLDLIKVFTRYALSGRAWDLVIEQRVLWMALFQ